MLLEEARILVLLKKCIQNLLSKTVNYKHICKSSPSHYSITFKTKTFCCTITCSVSYFMDFKCFITSL